MFRKVTFFLFPLRLGEKAALHFISLQLLSALSYNLLQLLPNLLNVLFCTADNQKPDEAVGFKVLCVLLNNLHLHEGWIIPCSYHILLRIKG